MKQKPTLYLCLALPTLFAKEAKNKVISEILKQLLKNFP